MTSSNRTQPSRRDVLKQSTAGVGAAVAGTLAVARGAHAAGNDVLKVALIGCGPRGTGAAVNALNADKNARLWAMADLFPENIPPSRKSIRDIKGDQVDVSDDRCFTGFDGYKRVLESGVDVVLLALPTFFHPPYLKACIEAGKHVFCEKIHPSTPPAFAPCSPRTRRPSRRA